MNIEKLIRDRMTGAPRRLAELAGALEDAIVHLGRCAGSGEALERELGAVRERAPKTKGCGA